MIFYRIVCTSWQHFRHLCPFISMSRVCQKQNPFFVGHPLNFKNAWVEMIMPSLPALFAEPALDEFSDERPSLRPILFYKFSN